MNIATWIALFALAVIVFFAVRYLYREKKKGAKCIGCPYCGSCSTVQKPQRKGEKGCQSTP